MTDKQKIMVIGDTHGDWGFLNNVINKKRPDIVLITGDFGHWPNFHGTYNVAPPGCKRQKWYLWDAIKNHQCKVYFAHGNHEDLDDLDAREKAGQTEIMPNVFYMPKGSTLTLPDGRNVLFFGGAESIDKSSRREGYDWFRQEVATYSDLFRLDAVKCKVDFVVSHTCPRCFTGYDSMLELNGKWNDPTRAILDYVMETFRPKLWYFGHWHCPKKEMVNDCWMTGLNMTRENQCWCWID